MAQRVLFPYVGSSVGGSHVSSLLLAQNLSSDFEPVIAVQQTGVLTEYLSTRSISYVLLPNCQLPRLRPMWRQPRIYWGMAKEFRKFLDNHKIDLVHSQDMKMHSAWSSVCRRLDVPHIWHQRTPSPSPHTYRLARHSAKRIAISEYCRSQLPKKMRSVTDVVFNPISDITTSSDEYKKRLIALTKAPENAILIGWVANMSARKRPQDFVDIAHRLLMGSQSERPLHFVMIGASDNPLASEIELMIENLGLTQDITLTGPLFPAQSYIAGLDVLVATASKEAFGRTLVEAMMSNIPVVASNEGGHREIIDNENTGYLVNRGDCGEFSKKIQSLFTDPVNRKMLVDAAHTDAVTRFSVGAHVGKMETVYRDVLAGVGNYK